MTSNDLKMTSNDLKMTSNERVKNKKNIIKAGDSNGNNSTKGSDPIEQAFSSN